MKKAEEPELDKFIFYIQNDMSDKVCTDLSLISREGFRDYKLVTEYVPYVKKLLDNKSDEVCVIPLSELIKILCKPSGYEPLGFLLGL